MRIKDLNHENLIKVFGCVTSPGWYIVLEYAEHGNLENFIFNYYDKLKKKVMQKIKGIIDGFKYMMLFNFKCS